MIKTYEKGNANNLNKELSKITFHQQLGSIIAQK